MVDNYYLYTVLKKMKAFSILILTLSIFSFPSCKKVECEWPYRADNSPNRCVEIRYDITGIYRGSNFRSDGLSKPYDEFGIWAYHNDPRTVTITPGTIECILTGDNTFYIFKQLHGGSPILVEIKEGFGFVKDTFMEMQYVYTKYGDTISPPTLFTFRGVKPGKNP